MVKGWKTSPKEMDSLLYLNTLLSRYLSVMLVLLFSSPIEGLMRLREEQKVSFSLSRDPDNVDDGSPQLWLSVYPDFPPNEIVNRCWEQ
ncbi:hypothetical protein [Saccharolobus islandicus]|uniref:Uncharacterized protein n=2 Tax=Saccharolobus islandicus TaxID=43080 RepID=C4KLC7_SACI6|nr:hypothetical protein [Sulfolobus islandicus]ACR43008.1 hypothetical protein M164_2411 [Sulfolobus islandicus M.16.4]